MAIIPYYIDSPVFSSPSYPLPVIPNISDQDLVVIVGRAPLFRFIQAFRALLKHGVKNIGIFDQRFGVIVIYSEEEKYIENSIMDIFEENNTRSDYDENR